MAQKRGSQRGVIQLTATALLAVVAALLVMTGCSADSNPEATGTEAEGIAICPRCPTATPCETWACNALTGRCEATFTADLTDCGDKTTGAPGVCVSGVCCHTCYRALKAGGHTCAAAIDAADCALPAGVCKVCNSGNKCIQDSCTANGTCAADAIKDGQSCTDQSGACLNGVCCTGCVDKNGACQAGGTTTACGLSSPAAGLISCKDCTDANPCTTDSCDATGACNNADVADTTSCADNNKCNGDETCTGGQCSAPANFMCPTDANPCHAPSCDPVTGCSQKNLSNVACPAPDKCSTTGVCATGVCQPGTQKSCDDKNPCTVDSCDPVAGCVNQPVEAGSDCDDGNLCNGIGVCDANGKCVVNASPKCDDGNPCTDDKCDAIKGCVTTNNTAPCSDNNLCTTNDACSNGKCVGGAAPNCQDTETCTTDSCDATQGCVHTPVKDGATCDDSNKCTTTDQCVGGSCKGSGGPSCDDGNPCTQNFCDVANNQACTNPDEKDGTACTLDACHQNTTCTTGKCGGGIAISCDDSNPCTIDSCDPVTGCAHKADDTAKCSDGDTCTSGDACKAGVCTSTPKTCTAIDDCHVAGTCDEKLGQCDDPRADDDTPCNKGKGTCQTGKCVDSGNGVGGAGGETGAGGDSTSTGGSAVAQGGEPSVVGSAGEGNESNGGSAATAGTTGRGGKSSGGSAADEGGAAEIPTHVFVRNPGGCRCSLPGSEPANDWAGLAGLIGLGLITARRRRRAA